MDFFRQEYINKAQVSKERKSQKIADMNNNMEAKKAK